MATIQDAPLPDATPTNRGAMTADQAAKLAAYPADPGDISGLIESVAAPFQVSGGGELSAPDASGATRGFMTPAQVSALANAATAADLAAAIAAITPGLVTNGGQTWAGEKTFTNGIVSPHVRNAGALAALYSDQAGSGVIATKVGTTQGAPHAQTELFRVSFGIGGTEVPRVRVQPGTALSHVVQITAPVASNAYHMLLDGGSAGWTGIHISNPGAGAGRLAFGSYGGDRMGLHVENGGLTFTQNANAYDNTRLMRWVVGSATAVAAGVPVFDFQAPANLQAGQRALLVQVGGVHKFGVTSVGPTVEPGVPIEINGHGGGVRAIYTGGIAGFMNAAGSAYIGFFPGTGRATASHGMLIGGDLESSLTAAGVILKSPDGTRYKLTIANGGAVNVAPA